MNDAVKQGWKNMGEDIPLERRSEALEHLKDMRPDIDSDKVWEIIGKMSKELERDNPYRAQMVCRDYLESPAVYESYRLLSVLLVSPIEDNE